MQRDILFGFSYPFSGDYCGAVRAPVLCDQRCRLIGPPCTQVADHYIFICAFGTGHCCHSRDCCRSSRFYQEFGAAFACGDVGGGDSYDASGDEESYGHPATRPDRLIEIRQFHFVFIG